MSIWIANLYSKYYEDIFDDSDEDPTYDQNRPQTSSFLDNLTSSTITDSDSDSEVSNQTPIGLYMPIFSNINRQVLSDDSDIDDESSDADDDSDIWSKVEDNFENNTSFSFTETPGPKNCPNLDSKPIDYFKLFLLIHY